jgi:hypothetical protein
LLSPSTGDTIEKLFTQPTVTVGCVFLALADRRMKISLTDTCPVTEMSTPTDDKGEPVAAAVREDKISWEEAG